jgi:hypothetical protein
MAEITAEQLGEFDNVVAQCVPHNISHLRCQNGGRNRNLIPVEKLSMQFQDGLNKPSIRSRMIYILESKSKILSRQY